MSVEGLTAYSTLGAVLVALFGIFFPKIINYINRPQLSIQFENLEPFCRFTYAVINIATREIIQKNAYHLRIKIRNVGRTTARRCKVKLVAIADQNLQRLVKEFDPVNLHWVGSDSVAIYANKNGERTTKFNKNIYLDINAGDYEFADLLSVPELSSKFEIQAIDLDIPRGIVLDPPRADYYYLISVYSDNADPVKKIYRVKNSEKYSDVKLLETDKNLEEKFFQLT